MKRLAFAALASAAALPLAGCDGADGARGNATFVVRMTDAPFPFDTADSAVVAVRRVELRASDDSTDAVVLYDGPEVLLNLLDLRDGVDTTLALSTIPAADYGQLRLIVAPDARVVMNDGTVYPLRVPSGAQTGIKINLPDLDLGDRDTVDVLVDFDVERSFVTQGTPGSPQGLRFSFRPVLQIDSLYVDGVALPRGQLPGDGEGEIDEGG